MNKISFTQAKHSYRNGYYAHKLEEGLQFQDYVARVLYFHGMAMINYSSRLYQSKHGENLLGVEIKRDGVFRQTERLYIETAEKSSPENMEYVASGIYRKDNAWLFLIGDEQDIYFFTIKHLRDLHVLKDETGELVFPRVRTPTSQGFLIPLFTAEQSCAWHIHVDDPESYKQKPLPLWTQNGNGVNEGTSF